ncbi:MAG TPA: hypothetical protein VIL89_10115 [Clostridia bacterium]
MKKNVCPYYENPSELAIDGTKSRAWVLKEYYNEITAGEEQMV